MIKDIRVIRNEIGHYILQKEIGSDNDFEWKDVHNISLSNAEDGAAFLHSIDGKLSYDEELLKEASDRKRVSISY